MPGGRPGYGTSAATRDAEALRAQHVDDAIAPSVPMRSGITKLHAVVAAIDQQRDLRARALCAAGSCATTLPAG